MTNLKKKLYSSLYDADFELSGERIGNQCNSCKIKDCKKGQIEKIINNINLIRSEDWQWMPNQKTYWENPQT